MLRIASLHEHKKTVDLITSMRPEDIITAALSAGESNDDKVIYAEPCEIVYLEDGAITIHFSRVLIDTEESGPKRYNDMHVKISGETITGLW